MATIATTGSNREARRRRISDRGSDRLALITGRIQSLPSNPDQSSTVTLPSNQISTDSSQHEDSSLQNHDSVREASQHDNYDATVEPLLHNGDKGKSIAFAAAALLGEEVQVYQVPSSVRSPAIQRQRKHQSHRNSLTTGEIISAISASESIRMCCAVAAAILVILSYTGFPILSWQIFKSTIIFRPLYLLLLTNVSIVIAPLILGKQGEEASTGQMDRVPSSSENGLIDQVGKALESGLLLQNVFGALFMDFSIYAVVLICGLSVAQRLGW